MILTRCLFLLALSGCTSLMQGSRTPAITEFGVALTPEAAYQRASKTATSMGAIIVYAEPPRQLQAHIHDAVLLTVTITPEPTGARLYVAARLLPNKIVLGSLTEHEDFRLAYGVPSHAQRH